MLDFPPVSAGHSSRWLKYLNETKSRQISDKCLTFDVLCCMSRQLLTFEVAHLNSRATVKQVVRGGARMNLRQSQ